MSTTFEANLAGIVGDAGVRAPSGAADIIDGVRPGVVVEPATAEGVANVLRWASSTGRTVVVRGGGSHDGWGRRPRPVDVLLGTRRINRLIAHEHGDLTATIESGASLAAVNRQLAQHGQWLPIDPPHAGDSTIGGILATNDAGPRRHRHGTPRDLVLGMTVALSDGTVARAGGRVVKNVAGYDLARLMAGSHGSLGVILSATFKLSPLPPADRTVEVRVRSADDVTRVAAFLHDEQHDPEAVDVRASIEPSGGSRFGVLVRYSTVRPAVDTAVDALVSHAVAAGHEAAALDDASAAASWSTHQLASWTGRETVLRLSWRPASFAAAYDDIARAAAGVPLECIGRVGFGSGLVGLAGDTARHPDVVAALRQSPHLAHVVIVCAPSHVRDVVDVWDTPASQRMLWQKLKQACDPTDTLNAGRGPL